MQGQLCHKNFSFSPRDGDEETGSPWQSHKLRNSCVWREAGSKKSRVPTSTYLLSSLDNR